jgi:hypothetical protein
MSSSQASESFPLSDSHYCQPPERKGHAHQTSENLRTRVKPCLSYTNTTIIHLFSLSLCFYRLKPSDQANVNLAGPIVVDFESTEFRSMQICR